MKVLDEPEVAKTWLEMISHLATIIRIPRINTRWGTRRFGVIISVQATWTLDDEIADGVHAVREKGMNIDEHSL